MHILIDKNRLVIIAKHENPTALSDLAWLELPHIPVAVIGCTLDELGTLTDFELRRLYKNTSDVDHITYSRDALLSVMHDISLRLEESKINAWEINKQASLVLNTQPYIQYKYTPGAAKATPQADLFEHTGLLVTRDAALEKVAATLAPRIVAVQPAPQHVAHTQSEKPLVARLNPLPKAEKLVSSTASSDAPRAGSKTGKVWEMADELYSPGTDIKALRKTLMEMCEAENINSSTAGVQFGRWKNAKLLNL